MAYVRTCLINTGGTTIVNIWCTAYLVHLHSSTMVKILVIGATGYIGRRFVSSLVQSGSHRVYGIARTPEKAATLSREEVIPVLSPDPVANPESWIAAIRDFNIDVVVDVAGAFQDSASFLSAVKTVGEERAQRFRSEGLRNAPKLGYVYCSGTWTHGSSDAYVNEFDFLDTKPPAIVAWRGDLEKAVLDSNNVLDVAIFRPALVYGRESTIWNTFFAPLVDAKAEDEVKIPLDRDAWPGLIHVDDVATGIQAVVERLPLVQAAFPIFDLGTTRESMASIFRAAAKSIGFQGSLELVGGAEVFSSAMGTSFNGSSSRAKQLLGWEPKRTRGMVADIDVIMAAFVANR